MTKALMIDTTLDFSLLSKNTQLLCLKLFPTLH